MTEKMTLEIGGMSCGHCVGAVRKALEKVPGVKVDDVQIGRATVEYDPAQVKDTAIRDAVDDAGYELVAAR